MALFRFTGHMPKLGEWLIVVPFMCTYTIIQFVVQVNNERGFKQTLKRQQVFFTKTLPKCLSRKPRVLLSALEFAKIFIIL